MPNPLQVTFDCTDAPAMARFWSAAVGYQPQPPPPGFTTWEDFGRAQGVPEEMMDAWAGAVDPAGTGPRFFFQRVPEAKSAKNRLHLDLHLTGRPGAGGLEDEVARLQGLGAERLDEHDEMGTHWVVMRDIEGNEFCVA